MKRMMSYRAAAAARWSSVSDAFRRSASAALQVGRKSLLIQLVSVYATFVLIVLATGLVADTIGQRQLQSQMQSSDVALGQEVAFDTSSRLTSVENSLIALSRLPVIRAGATDEMTESFAAFRVARQDVDQVYWVNSTGVLRVSVPMNLRTLGENLAGQPMFQRAIRSDTVVIQADIVDLTTFNADINFAIAIRDGAGHPLGVLGATILLDELNSPIQSVMSAQAAQGQSLRITILDSAGRIIASPEREQLQLYGEPLLPGSVDALHGKTATLIESDAQGQRWLYSAVPISGVGWAVIIQQPASQLAAAVSSFQGWLAIATALFALGGLLFWLVLVWRVVRPLRQLTESHMALVGAANRDPGDFRAWRDIPRNSLSRRADELGSLARILTQLRHDVALRLTELRTLLDTSNAVVHSLDPHAVGRDIIREVRRLVDVQAAAVLVPEETGALRTLISEGCEFVTFSPAEAPAYTPSTPAARALQKGRPMQLVADGNPAFPARSYAQGFRAVLALPIITRRVGGVILEVQRTQPLPFTENEINLLLTFANYAALAWEHAVLYERSDERLRAIALENARLYQQANAERQTLAAIMRSMSDGLLLASASGAVLYANPGARALIDLPQDEIEGACIESIYEALARAAEQTEHCRDALARLIAGEIPQCLLHSTPARGGRVYTVRVFDVRDEHGQAIGRGMLLRDITREQEVDQFKTTLLAAVGHELRTPLAAIKGHASTLLQDDVTWSGDEQRHFLSVISAEADRMAQMITNLFDLSRLEAGLLLLHRSPCRLANLVDETLARLNGDHGAVSVDLPVDLPLVDVDAPRIEVVLRNLVVNAHAYGDGPVRVRAWQEDQAVVVEVADSGPGIADEDLPHIFERFYRASHGQRRGVGVGLGLAISKAFVSAHGGRIWAQNGSIGAAISFTLPIVNTSESGVSGEISSPGLRI